MALTRLQVPLSIIPMRREAYPSGSEACCVLVSVGHSLTFDQASGVISGHATLAGAAINTLSSSIHFCLFILKIGQPPVTTLSPNIRQE